MTQAEWNACPSGVGLEDTVLASFGSEVGTQLNTADAIVLNGISSLPVARPSNLMSRINGEAFEMPMEIKGERRASGIFSKFASSFVGPDFKPAFVFKEKVPESKFPEIL